ncbi:MAG: DUF3572 domain-containing protein [Rhodobacteraceae bacterium]|nr:DUF3572 domain-containing protein [Paracoccaceae bacterium]
MQQDQAESIAIQALGWLASDGDLLGMFMGASGADVSDLRKIAGDPVFLGSVLDFILIDDSHVTGFCDATNLSYDAPMRARQALPGGAQVNWT